ncbi:hypothetical protein JYA35_15130 [Bacillus velezensis]|uniref:hypothetical protein n=1 Tax=Bacillus velezensis TaxID=492670 RepID=UPI0019D3EAD3|nr:hypothetical protein [Bacillus velezensis]
MEYKTVTVRKQQFGVGRIVCLTIGILLVLFGFLLSLTIIGIIAGGMLIIFSLPFFAMAKSGAKYTCPNCGYKHNGVASGSVNATCRRCKQNIAVNWLDPPSKNKSDKAL